MIAFNQPVLLVVAAVAVGVLHTMVPDHWVPIALLARRQGWTRMQTARTAAVAGLGHTGSTLVIAVIVWLGGSALATRFGNAVNLASSAALIAFGLWIALGSWREMQQSDGDAHGQVHEHADKRSSRTALLLILGSSPMVEGIPAFFAAGRYGVGLLAIMAVLFALSTTLTYVALSVASAGGMQRLRFGRFERYGEVFSGAFIALLGLLFLFW